MGWRHGILIQNHLVALPEAGRSEAGIEVPVLATLMSNLAHYGYALSMEALQVLRTTPEDSVSEWWARMEPALKKVTGDDKDYESFVVYKNFFVIKRYNNATSYAMGVGHLGDRIAGGGPFVQSWPRGERSLSRSEKEELQRRLTSAGFNTGSTDGIIGPDTEAAIRRYQAANGMTPDGFASSALLEKMR